jgi:hypothetical protein
LAFDRPGTGETAIPLDEHADEVIRGLADYARTLGDSRVAHFGASFGGNFAAMSGLSGIVDAAVDLGGPVNHAFEPENVQKLPYGMHDILGNAMHRDHSLTLDELSAGLGQLNRENLLAQQHNSAMLVVNGADDYFIPQSDTLVFQGRPKTEVPSDRGHRPRRDEQGSRGGADDHCVAAQPVRLLGKRVVAVDQRASAFEEGPSAVRQLGHHLAAGMTEVVGTGQPDLALHG